MTRVFGLIALDVMAMILECSQKRHPSPNSSISQLSDPAIEARSCRASLWILASAAACTAPRSNRHPTDPWWHPKPTHADCELALVCIR